MRRYIKTKVLMLLDTLMEANIFVERYVKRGNLENVSLLLDDEQQATLRIKEIVEESEGKEHKAVTLLEEYYRLLLQCSVEQGEGKRAIVDKLNKEVSLIVDTIKKMVPTRYDVIFLPYKASMWDSLESVWLAAKEDEDCDCYVIPIPYYDKKRDGSFGELHEEGSQYPDYVPITSYKDYDIQSRQPEVVFIHNPYDQYNRVTSIHPAFYSSNLAKCTDLLIYIPYFISAMNVKEDYCTTPGVLNSNLVIVQSRQVRDTYLRVLKKLLHLTDDAAKAAGLYKKFVVMGSPKIDKVLNTKIENIALPKEWKKMIYN